MLGCKVRIIHERSNIIQIPKNSSSLNEDYNAVTYSLKQNCFDPSKCSPPNEFMIKLHKRMSLYESESLATKDDKRDKE